MFCVGDDGSGAAFGGLSAVRERGEVTRAAESKAWQIARGSGRVKLCEESVNTEFSEFTELGFKSDEFRASCRLHGSYPGTSLEEGIEANHCGTWMINAITVQVKFCFTSPVTRLTRALAEIAVYRISTDSTPTCKLGWALWR